MNNKRKHKNAKNLNAVEATFGIWKDRDFEVEEYIRNLRIGNRLKEQKRIKSKKRT